MPVLAVVAGVLMAAGNPAAGNPAAGVLQAPPPPPGNLVARIQAPPASVDQIRFPYSPAVLKQLEICIESIKQRQEAARKVNR